jgi:hypothetical protein
MLCSRRHFLNASSMGIGSLALSWLLREEGLLAAPSKPLLEEPHYDLLPKRPHFEAKAKAMISIFLIGGPSQIDLFDYKPALAKLDGKDFPDPTQIKYDNPGQASKRVLGPAWKYKKYGKCGMEMAEIIPHIGSIADDITLIRSMHTGVNNHLPSMYALNTGKHVGGRAHLGSWLSYGLGTENQNLPSFVNLIDPRGGPLIGGENWTNGWLPSLYQGTVVRPKEPRILNLDPPAHLKGTPKEKQLDLLRTLNAEHLKQHPGELDLEARIASYELAARMQTAAKEAFDISRESTKTHQMYGIDNPKSRDYGMRCLIARRLVERGVRFVQILNPGQSWDHHGAILKALPNNCAEVDQPSAALVKDLKARGLLDSTVVFWGGEMGRLPVIQDDTGKEKVGRDHNTYGFSAWVAGGGFKGGYTHGETDEFAHKAVKDIVTHTDYQHTLLHLFGLDAKKLVYKRQAQEYTLTDNQAGRVVTELLA